MKSLLFSLSIIAYSIHAADDAQMRNLENRVAALEQRKNSGGVILPSAGANLDDDVGLSLDGELLIWKAHQTGMNYGQGIISTGGVYTDTNPYLKPNFVFDPGLRLSAGLRPNHDDWQLDASWTFFYTKAKGNFEDASVSIIPLFQVFDYSPTTVAHNLNSAWRVNLNMIDLDLSRASFMSKWTSLKPYISIRNMWLHQKYNLGAVIDNGYHSGNLRSNFWSIGPRAGFELKFSMGEGFYFFNNTSGALLWGFFKNSQDSTGYARREEYVHTSTYNVDMSLGLGWDRKIDDNHYRISLRGAWEHHIFFATNFFQSSARFDNFTAFDQANGNFTLEGFTFTARFDF